MLNTRIRAAITGAGGTPTQYGPVYALREFVTALGGAPTQYTVQGLLREAITAAGGTPTQYGYIPLLRQLVTALGGTPETYAERELWEQIVELSGGGSPPAGTVDFFVFAGQSLMQGTNTTRANRPANLVDAVSNVRIYQPTTNTLNAYQASYNSNPGFGRVAGTEQDWGQEAEFIRRWGADNPSGQAVAVKLAPGNTALQSGVNTNLNRRWDPALADDGGTTNTNLALMLKTDVDAAKALIAAEGKTIARYVFVWDQGQNDAADLEQAPTYGTALAAFETWARTNIMGGTTGPFVVIAINELSAWTYRSTVRLAQAKQGAVASNVVINSLDIPLGTDGVHYSPAGYVTLGERAYVKAGATTAKPNMIEFWDFNDNTKVFSNSGRTTQATAGSSNAVSVLGQTHALPLTDATAPPSYITDALSGRKAAKFTAASTQRLQQETASAPLLTGFVKGEDKPFTIVALVRRGSVAATRAFSGISRLTTQADYHRQGFTTAGVPFGGLNINNITIGNGLGPTEPADVWVVVTIVYDGTQYTVRRNAVAGTPVAANTGAVEWDWFGLGGVYWQGGPSYLFPFDGAIEAYGLFRGALTTDALALESELRTRAGL